MPPYAAACAWKRRSEWGHHAVDDGRPARCGARRGGGDQPAGLHLPAGQLRRDRVFLVLFAETGLLIGFFLPGDSLLFTAGLLSTTAAANKVHLSLPVVLIAAAAGALLGAQT